MSHVVNCVRRTVDAWLDSWVASGASWVVLEHWAWFILVTLQTLVQWSIWLVERLIYDPWPHAHSKALLTGVLSVISPDLRTLLSEAQFHDALLSPLQWKNSFETTCSYRLSQVHRKINSKVLSCRASTTGSLMSYNVACILSIFFWVKLL